MAISIVSYAASAFNSATTPKTVGSVAWSTGDRIVVAGVIESEGVSISTPTNGSLTFSLADSSGASASEAQAYIWTATAGSNQTGQTISAARGASSNHFGIAVWVVSGAAAVGVTADSKTESTLSLSVASGSAVFYVAADYNAVVGPSRTLATGSGTPTERADDDSAQYAWCLGEWLNTSAGTFGFGLSSYTGWKVSQVAVELTASGGATLSRVPFSRHVALTFR